MNQGKIFIFIFYASELPDLQIKIVQYPNLNPFSSIFLSILGPSGKYKPVKLIGKKEIPEGEKDTDEL